MLCFLTRDQHQYTIRVFQTYTDAHYLRIISHDELTTYPFCSEDVVIFCDIDRCNDPELEELKSAYDLILQTGCRILNNPSKVLRRYPLLRGLYTDHTNAFQVYRPHELPPPDEIVFPVFIRDELEHNGPETGLISTPDELKQVLAGPLPQNPLVCEFVDTATDGFYHKYGAFIVDGTIIPRHFFLSDAWSVKNATGAIHRSVQPEMDYIRKNPHENELRQIARYAGIEFGRIDYAMTDKGMQVFEINTNPTVINEEDVVGDHPRQQITHWFMDTFTQTLKDLRSSPTS